ncbi:hypothetical protein [Streptomyces sp. NPDC051776]|uniref:hypothetical protein n=1 Tax=Streptomyces sp. NPDC051776 TaxID=3155414 RepID=UPI00341CE840
MSNQHDGPDSRKGLDGLMHDLRKRTGPKDEPEGGPSPHEDSPRPHEDALRPAENELRPDEDALRRLLHTAVDELEPSPDALEHLRRAVPVRRARKRQVLVGAAAAVLLVGTAVPALMHAALSDGNDDRPANAGHSEVAQGGTTNGSDAGGGDGAGDLKPSDKATGDSDKDGKNAGTGDDSQEPGGNTAGAGAGPSETMAATSPVCTRDQLTNGAATPGTLDGASTVYGSFRVSNTSESACAIDGGGLVLASAQGGADGSRISVIDHTAGDAATGLPDPATEPQRVILKPGVAYEVKFAWIPADGGSGGCPAPGNSPDPGGTGDPGGQPAADGSADDPAPSTGSVELSHTPQAGDPAASSATITNACAGTIYRTGALEAS